MQLPRSLKLVTAPGASAAGPANGMVARRGQMLARSAPPEMGTQQPVWECNAGVQRPSGSVARSLTPALETAMIAILMRPLAVGENQMTGNTNRERELGQLFSALEYAHAREILRRLDLDRADDALVAAFKRITIERRARLRAFLADTRRRQALQRG
ncbi:MAG: hypothetical protein JWP01_3021 [Myxococcales bacterium]|nr:hypothetical protein [Myxococcales bacterium]